MPSGADPSLVEQLIAKMRGFVRGLDSGARRATRRYVAENVSAFTDELEALLASLPQQERTTEWQPIETAPELRYVHVVDEMGFDHIAAQTRPHKWRDRYENTIWRPTVWRERPALPAGDPIS